VLGCNNYEVIDLGVMVPCREDFAGRTRAEVDIIGLSDSSRRRSTKWRTWAREMERQG